MNKKTLNNLLLKKKKNILKYYINVFRREGGGRIGDSTNGQSAIKTDEKSSWFKCRPTHPSSGREAMAADEKHIFVVMVDFL